MEKAYLDSFWFLVAFVEPLSVLLLQVSRNVKRGLLHIGLYRADCGIDDKACHDHRTCEGDEVQSRTVIQLNGKVWLDSTNLDDIGSFCATGRIW